jgi:hypothetical protein
MYQDTLLEDPGAASPPLFPVLTLLLRALSRPSARPLWAGADALMTGEWIN